MSGGSQVNIPHFYFPQRDVSSIDDPKVRSVLYDFFKAYDAWAQKVRQWSLQQGTSATGTIVPIPTATPPAGYLHCDGSAVSRTQYATLFSVIGTQFGAGDGSTTFNIPNIGDIGLSGVSVPNYIKT